MGSFRSPRRVLVGKIAVGPRASSATLALVLSCRTRLTPRVCRLLSATNPGQLGCVALQGGGCTLVRGGRGSIGTSSTMSPMGLSQSLVFFPTIQYTTCQRSSAADVTHHQPPLRRRGRNYYFDEDFNFRVCFSPRAGQPPSLSGSYFEQSSSCPMTPSDDSSTPNAQHPHKTKSKNGGGASA